MKPKVQSILSYIGILWLLAYFGGREERNELSRYHLKQGLGLWIVTVLFNLVLYLLILSIPTLGSLLGLLGLIFFIFMILGIIAAANEAKKPLPIIGKIFERRFNFIDRS